MKEIFNNGITLKTKYNGFVDETFSFVEKNQLNKPELWARFVKQFREDADYEGNR